MALVSQQFDDYLGGFLFSLALATDVEIPSVHLESKAADAGQLQGTAQGAIMPVATPSLTGQIHFASDIH